MNPKMIAITAIVAVGAAAGGYGLGHMRADGHQTEAANTDGRGRILYYRNPMGEADTSPVPKKDSMGMDYIPVYAHEVPSAPGSVAVDIAKVQRAGVRTAAVTRHRLSQEIHAVGTVTFNDTQVAVSSPRVEGWIERVHAVTAGTPVKAGQLLAEIYSPELLQTQQEYFLARDAGDSAGIAALADGALQRLRNLGLSETQVRQIAAGKAPQRIIAITAPAAGVISAKNAAVGQKFMPGDVLYRIADVSTVWVMAKVYEQDLQFLHMGMPAAIAVKAVQGDFKGTVSLMSPMLDPETRTADVRIEVPNPGGALRGDMFATVAFARADAGDALAVPQSAIIDSGTRRVVLVAKDNGHFEPRAVETGAKAGDYTAVTRGVAEGEEVVTQATFLIDSESNLRAALQSFADTPEEGAKP